MPTPKISRPPFQPIEIDLDNDPIDARLDAKAVEKGIPTLVLPKLDTLPAIEPAATTEQPMARQQGRAVPKEATPRSRMRGLKIELPDYVWVAAKKRAAEEMVSLRHLIMTALRAKG